MVWTKTTASSFLSLNGGFNHPTTGGMLPFLSPGGDPRVLTSALGQRPALGRRQAQEADSFLLGSMTSLLLCCSALHSWLYPACRGKEQTRETKVVGWEPEAHMSTHAGGKVPLLLPLPAQVASETLPEVQPHMKEPASFPGLKLAMCSHIPTLWGLSDFRVSCQLSKANSITVT